MSAAARKQDQTFLRQRRLVITIVVPFPRQAGKIAMKLPCGGVTNRRAWSFPVAPSTDLKVAQPNRRFCFEPRDSSVQCPVENWLKSANETLLGAVQEFVLAEMRRKTAVI